VLGCWGVGVLGCWGVGEEKAAVGVGRGRLFGWLEVGRESGWRGRLQRCAIYGMAWAGDEVVALRYGVGIPVRKGGTDGQILRVDS